MNDVQMRPEVQREVERAVSGRADAFLERIAERLGGAANAAAVYGTPVERDGVTVIPVARVRWGFGGGGGTGPEGQGGGSGSGGGGGAMATPAGYIEIRDGVAEFRPIQDPMSLLAIPPIIIAAGITAALVLRGLRRLFRG